MKIQIISDLHIDWSENYNYCLAKIYPEADVLIVGGDTCPYTYNKKEKFKDSFFSRWKTVVEVPGNHDHYGLQSGWKHANELYEKHFYGDCHYYYIHNGSIILPDTDIKIICSTLWSHIGSQNMLPIFRSMNDFNYIDKLTIDDYNSRNKKSVHFIDKELENSSHEYRCIILTHHLPTFSLINERYQGSCLNEAYANSLDKLIDKHFEKIDVWAYGHTHTPTIKEVDHIKFVNASLGYPYEYNKNFKNTIIEIN